jgi:Fe-S cluster assembly protein SufB
MELSTYFRINARNTGQFERTLIIADEVPRSAISRAARRRCATSISCTRRLSNSSRRRRDDQMLDDSELVLATRTARAASTTSSQARQGDGEREDHWTQVETGSAIPEVSELHPAGDHHRRVLFGGDDQQLAAGRPAKMITSARNGAPSFQGYFRSRQNSVSRRREIGKNARRAQLLAVRFALIGDKCGATRSRISNQEHVREGRARSVDVEDRRRPDLLLPPAGIATEDAVNMIVSGFCKEVSANCPWVCGGAQKLLSSVWKDLARVTAQRSGGLPRGRQGWPG